MPLPPQPSGRNRSPPVGTGGSPQVHEGSIRRVRSKGKFSGKRGGSHAAGYVLSVLRRRYSFESLSPFMLSTSMLLCGLHQQPHHWVFVDVPLRLDQRVDVPLIVPLPNGNQRAFAARAAPDPQAKRRTVRTLCDAVMAHPVRNFDWRRRTPPARTAAHMPPRPASSPRGHRNHARAGRPAPWCVGPA